MFKYLLFAICLSTGAAEYEVEEDKKETLVETVSDIADDFVDLAQNIKEEIVEGYRDVKESVMDAKDRFEDEVDRVKKINVIQFKCKMSFGQNVFDWDISTKNVDDIDGFEFDFKASPKDLTFSLNVDTKKFKVNW